MGFICRNWLLKVKFYGTGGLFILLFFLSMDFFINWKLKAFVSLNKQLGIDAALIDTLSHDHRSIRPTV